MQVTKYTLYAPIVSNQIQLMQVKFHVLEIEHVFRIIQ
jgi:hypothetical protein